VHISLQLMSLDFEAIGAASHSMLSSELAHRISDAIGSPVVDLFGQANTSTLEKARVAGIPGVKVSVFTTVPEGSSATAMAKELYATSFRNLVATLAEEVLQRDGNQNAIVGKLSAPVVAVKPERFVPRVHTTVTTTSTFTTTATTRNLRSTSTTAAIAVDEGRTTGSYHYDMSSTSKSELPSPVSAATTSSGVSWAAIVVSFFLLRSGAGVM